jgi:putative endonuclease
MTDPRHRLGRAAEEAVAGWLASAGWQVRGRNVRSVGGGEVDLVCIDPHDVMVAVEVRARTSHRAGEAAVSVDTRRVRRLQRTLVAHAAATPVPHAGLRVDLVTAEPQADAPGHWRLRRMAGIDGG